MQQRGKTVVTAIKDICHFRWKYGIGNMVCCLSKESVKSCGMYLMYRVQLALYEIFREAEPELDWEEFVQILCEQPEIRRTALDVAIQTVKDYPQEGFDFREREEAETEFADLSEDEIGISQLFSEREAEALTLLLMLRAEMAHHQMLRCGRKDYELRAYMKALRRDGALRETLNRGFRRSMETLNFRAGWLRGGVQRLIEQYDRPDIEDEY